MESSIFSCTLIGLKLSKMFVGHYRTIKQIVIRNMEAVRGSKLNTKKTKNASKSCSLNSASELLKDSRESLTEKIFSMELEKFCPKKIFYIIFAVEKDEKSTEILDSFVKMNEEYKDISFLSFITRDDVMDLLDTSKNLIFPNQLKPMLINFTEIIKEFKSSPSGNIPSIIEAQLLKLKLIQVMYQQYVFEVKKNEKRKKLETLLGSLTKECRKKPKKDDQTKEAGSQYNKSPTRDDAKKKTKKEEEANKDEEIDYTLIPLDNDGISFEENFFEHMWFYCIKGYSNMEVIQILANELNVKITSIVRVSDDEEQENNCLAFWDDVKKSFFDNTVPYEFFETTMLMKYCASRKQTVLQSFQEFVYTVRTIPEIQLNHFKFLKHLSLNVVQNVYATLPIECTQYYNEFLNKLPLECTNCLVLLDALVKEVSDYREFSDSRSTIFSRSSCRSIQSAQCVDPLQDFLPKYLQNNFLNSTRKPCFEHNFLTHAHNTLLKILKSYKMNGKKVFDSSFNVLSVMPTLSQFSEHTKNCDEIFHSHDVEPSTRFQMENEEKEVTDHLMYLFLFNRFSNASDCLDQQNDYDLVKNLITYNKVDFWNSVQPALDSDEFIVSESLYDISVINFHWIEKITRELMAQEIYRASLSYSYAEQRYSPETDNILIVFTDKLNEFGLNVTIFETELRTPICLRDYCRYSTLKEKDWIAKNQVQIMNEDDFKKSFIYDKSCPGATKVKTRFKIFDEYAHLLAENFKEEDPEKEEELVDSRAEFIPQGAETEVEKSRVNFEEVFSDLQRYTSTKRLISECGSESEPSLLGYDLGSNLLKVTGHVTTFCSHDGVKVTVDNTRFLQSPEKCTINVICDGNTLTLHSSKSLLSQPYTTTIVFKDETRLSFEIYDRNTSVVSDLENITEEVIDDVSVEDGESVEEISNAFEQAVYSVDEEYFQSVLGVVDVEELVIENNDDLVECLKSAKENSGVIYKINANCKNLKRLNNKLKIPIQQVLKNVLPRERYLKTQTFATHTKRFLPKNSINEDLLVKNSIDFRICLPTGLFIRTHPSTVNENISIVKQEYVSENPGVRHEEFRLFDRQGIVLIKTIDGNLTILKANGDVIEFKEPQDRSDEVFDILKPCRCKTLDDYRNKLNKMLKHTDDSDCFISRRAHMKIKQNYIVDKKIQQLLEAFDVPYRKIHVTRMNGTQIKIKGNKVSEKQLYYLTRQTDFFTDEIYFERSDDLKSVLDKTGLQKVLFPDGTMISSGIETSEELVDDFVFVKLSFRYEHEYYATVKYNFDDSIEIFLNNDVVLKQNYNDKDYTVLMPNNTLISVTNTKISLKKSCSDCPGYTTCNFNITPFFESSWRPLENFLHIQDSYKKNFYSDYVGNCSRNSEYVQGPLNSFNCNHHKNTNYKKMFVLNRDLSGQVFHTNEYVKGKVNKMKGKSDSRVNTYSMISNKDIEVIDCRIDEAKNYSKRYFNNHILNNFNQTETSDIFCTNFRVFHRMIKDIKTIENFVSDLQQIFFSESFIVSESEFLFKNIASFVHKIEFYKDVIGSADYQNDDNGSKKQLKRTDTKPKITEVKKHDTKPDKCKCTKIRLSMEDKVNRWRKECLKYKDRVKKMVIPNYFASEFCSIEK